MLTGMLMGWLLRKQDMGWIHRFITLLIWVLLFLLGMEVGGNEKIIRSIGTLGIEAVVMTLGGTFGSVVFAWALWRVLYGRKGGGA